MIAKGGIPGELDHPTDRIETASEKIAIMMPEAPKKDSDGHLIAYFDIIDTPCGRIAYALAKYGFKLGISSRGEGDTYSSFDGEEIVDEGTYRFNAFDLVLLPACEDARLDLIAESINSKTFKQAINESLEKATPDEKKVMQETLSNLNIDFENKASSAANNAGANMLKDLQEAITVNKNLESEVSSLQEKLSVCYAKELKYQEDINKYKSTIRNLSQKTNKLEKLESKLSLFKDALNEKNNSLNAKQDSLNSLLIEKRNNSNKVKSLNESLVNKENELRKATLKINKLEENINNLSEKVEQTKLIYEEQLAESKKDLNLKVTSYNNKLKRANELIEKYQKITNEAIDKYIDIQALRLGLNKNEVLNKLPQNYSFDDIDSICENLANFNLTVNNLPFKLNKDTKIKINENKDPILSTINNLYDDTVDEDLLSLAKLK